MTRPNGRVALWVVAGTALLVAVAALVVALTRTHSNAAAAGSTTTVTSSAASVPRAGTLHVDAGRPTLQLAGYVRIPITHVGTYTWTGHLISAPPSVMSFGGNPDSGSEDHRIDGTARVANFRSTWVGDFPKGRMIAERVTFRVVSFSGKPFVELLGATVSGAPRTTVATTSP